MTQIETHPAPTHKTSVGSVIVTKDDVEIASFDCLGTALKYMVAAGFAEYVVDHGRDRWNLRPGYDFKNKPLVQ